MWECFGDGEEGENDERRSEILKPMIITSILESDVRTQVHKVGTCVMISQCANHYFVFLRFVIIIFFVLIGFVHVLRKMM